MGITEPFGRLMRWRLCRCEFTFNIVCKKGNLTTQADVLSRLQFLGHTTVPLDEEVPTFPDDHTVQREQAAILFDSDVYNHIPITHEGLRNPPLVPINSAKMLRDQQNDRFCRDIIARLHTGKGLAFSKSVDGKSFQVA